MVTLIAQPQTADLVTESPARRTSAFLCSLHNLGQRQEAIVHHLDLPIEDRNRLEIMGICPGRKICVTRGGDPLIVRVHESHMGLALDWARSVVVHPCDQTSPQADESFFHRD